MNLFERKLQIALTEHRWSGEESEQVVPIYRHEGGIYDADGHLLKDTHPLPIPPDIAAMVPADDACDLVLIWSTSGESTPEYRGMHQDQGVPGTHEEAKRLVSAYLLVGYPDKHKVQLAPNQVANLEVALDSIGRPQPAKPAGPPCVACDGTGESSRGGSCTACRGKGVKPSWA